MPNCSISLQSAKPRPWGILQVKWLEFFHREIVKRKKKKDNDKGWRSNLQIKRDLKKYHILGEFPGSPVLGTR